MSLVLAVAAMLWLALSPYTYTGTSAGATATVSPSGQVVESALPVHTEHASLIAVNGLWTLALLAIPVSLAALGLLGAVKGYGKLLLAAAVALLVFCLLGAMSIGLFYAPAAIALLVAALAGRRKVERFGGEGGAREAPFER